MTQTAEKEKQYKISEMTKFINVEAHVLRYWEEELHLPIKRNELGHRYYTEEDKEIFLKVKKLKEKGVQLRGIRTMLNLSEEKPVLTMEKTEEPVLKIEVAKVGPRLDEKEETVFAHTNTEDTFLEAPKTEESNTTLRFNDDREEKSVRLQRLLKNFIQEAVEESNAKLAEDIKECLVKEMDYQFRVASEEEEQHREAYRKQQEEYFQKLDEMIQNSRYVKQKKTPHWLKKTKLRQE